MVPAQTPAPPPSQTKRCRDCGVDKPVSEFWRRAASADRLAYYCKPCFSERNRQAADRRAAKAGRTRRQRPAGPKDLAEGMKWCSRCQQVLPIEAFVRNKNTRSGLGSYCRPCQAAQGAESRTRLYGSSRHYHLRRRYGIGADEVERMLEEQLWTCPICSGELTLRSAHVDHDHGTGAVRGILCFNCNGGLGQFRDRPDALRRAMLYLTAAGAATYPDGAASRLDALFASTLLRSEYAPAS